jgi:hypothetical protein
MSAVELIERPGHWILRFDGHWVTQCRVDDGFTLIIGNEVESFEVRIEQWFELTFGGEKTRFDPQTDPTLLGPALTTLHTGVMKAVASADGQLVVTFVDKALLYVPPCEDYEPWTLSGPAGLRLVSMPGGELAIWRPEAPSR